MVLGMENWDYKQITATVCAAQSARPNASNRRGVCVCVFVVCLYKLSVETYIRKQTHIPPSFRQTLKKRNKQTCLLSYLKA